MFLTVFFTWLPWALATPLVLYLGRHYPLRLRPVSGWLRHLAAFLAIQLVSSAWATCLEELLNPMSRKTGPGPFMPLWLRAFDMHTLMCLVLYGTILLAGHMFDARERLARQQTEVARLNEQLSKAQLDALRRQFEPHFLFNTLNAITGLIRKGKNDAAISITVMLGDLLQRVLKESQRQEAPLGEELEFLQKYLDIQQMRFAERLRLQLDVPRELSAARVPTLVLQPIVENAIKHGIATRTQGGLVRISADRSDGVLTLSVYNDGPALPRDGGRDHSGIGMANVRARLHSLYGDAFGLEMRDRDPGGVEVSVSVPFSEG